jgi:hypothetical protein
MHFMGDREDALFMGDREDALCFMGDRGEYAVSICTYTPRAQQLLYLGPWVLGCI